MFRKAPFLSLPLTCALLSAAPLLQEPTSIVESLKKAKITLNNYSKTTTNPLISTLTPKTLRDESITEYEFHAWSEANEKGLYPVYRWEKASTSEFYNNFERAKYSDEGVIDEKEFFKELDEKQRQTLLSKLQSGVILGALTKKELMDSDKSDSEVFYLIVKEDPTPTTPEKTEKQIPSFAPPAIDPSQVFVSPNNDPEPFGVPVPDKKGFIYSPFIDGYGISGTEKKEIIDATGLSRGTRVKDPYTQKVIRVP